jgi:hypothetical protein
LNRLFLEDCQRLFPTARRHDAMTLAFEKSAYGNQGIFLVVHDQNGSIRSCVVCLAHRGLSGGVPSVPIWNLTRT